MSQIFTKKCINFIVGTILCSGFITAVHSDEPENEKKSVDLNICRNSSLIRATHKPDIFINDVLAGEVANGSKFKVSTKMGDKYSIKTQASPLMFRFKTETLFQGSVDTEEQVYLIVKGELASIGAVASQLLGGAIAESIRQNTDKSPSGDWTIKVVSPSDFEIQCNDAK
jgi:hypothetical protein